MDMPATSLSAKDLCIGYPNKRQGTIVAKNINLSLHQGHLVAVIGINGSGKSTLLRTLAALQPSLSGKVLIDDKPIEQLESKELSKYLSLVLTEQHISKNLTVKELVTLGRQPYTNWIGALTNEDKQCVKAALKAVGILDLEDISCSQLSDGQLQKVLLARALAQDTKLIILDEPTTHLDLHHKASIFKLLKGLTRTTKKTIVFATHEINMALNLCDKIVLIKDAKVISGTPEEIINSHQLTTLFPQELIKFDSQSKQFSLKF